MEEFAEGGRLSPLKVKEFIPAGTLGIGVDDNVWIRKARKDGKTYWAEFIETWNFKRFKPQGYDLKLGIHFSAKPELDEKYGFELKYGYTDFGGFILDIYDADTMLTVNKYETLDPQKFRDICINVRQTLMPNDPILKYEFTELVGKLTSAFEKGELRKEFTEKPSEEETKPQFKVGDIVKVIGVEKEYKVIDVVKRLGVIFVKVEALDDESIQSHYSQDELELSDDAPDSKYEIGDYVRVVDRGEVVPTYTKKFIEYKFLNPNIANGANNGDEGYVVGIFDDSFEKPRYVIKKLDARGAILHEFIIDEKGLELVKKAPQIGDSVFIKDTNYLYPSAPTLKEKLGFSDPNSISKANEVYLSSGTIFSKGQDTVFLPIYGVYCTVLQQQVLMNIQGIADKDPLEFEKPFSLRGKKIIVDNAKESELLQEYAYSKGFAFMGYPKGQILDLSPYPTFMQFTNNDAMFVDSMKNFNESDYIEVTFEELGLIQESTPEPLPIEETEFTCNVDSTKINSAYVGAFYSKNKERIEKLNSEFSCKILEALVYLSDYENCGGGVQLPIQEPIEEDDLLGAIRNLK
jgi:hypothetical protein